jgi:hypothetical protein
MKSQVTILSVGSRIPFTKWDWCLPATIFLDNFARTVRASPFLQRAAKHIRRTEQLNSARSDSDGNDAARRGKSAQSFLGNMRIMGYLLKVTVSRI